MYHLPKQIGIEKKKYNLLKETSSINAKYLCHPITKEQNI